MSFTLILVSRPAYQSRSAHESLEAIMSLALFDIEHKVVFFEQGITWLTDNQHPSNSKSLEKQINGLPMYDCDQLYYVSEHRIPTIGESSVNGLIDPISIETLSQWFQEAIHVEVF
jgi:sulfur relay (sulfurtransferase) DsrF/TusC family protein